MIKFEKIEDQIIYSKIKQILDSNNTNRNKQRKIEKLMNVFLLKKQEDIWFINPLWKNTILEIFNKELNEFSNIYLNHFINNDMLMKIDYIYDFVKILNDNELFNIIIYSFFENLNEDFFKQKITFISNIVNNLLNFYLHIFKFIYLKKNINKYCKIDNINNLSENWFEAFKDQINILYKKRKKDFVLTFNIFILECLKQNYEKIDKRYTIYKTTVNEFNKDFKNDLFNESKILEKNLTKAIHILINLLENKTEIFNNFKGNFGKKSYDYMYLFNFEIFNKINNTYYLLSQIPMISIPKKWNIKGQKGGFLLNNNNIMPLTKKLAKGFSKIEYNAFFVDSINIAQEKKYKICNFYLNFIQTPFFKNENNIPEIETLKNLYIQLDEIKNKISSKNFKNYLLEYKSLICSSIYKKKSKEQKDILINDLKKFFELTDDDFLLYNKYLNSYKNFYKLYNYYKEYEFIINICKLFKDFYLFIPNKTDFRGRFYPIGRILHRASGKYKYLLYDDQDFTDFSKSNKYIYLLIEYISVSFKVMDEFKKEDLHSWFIINIEKPIIDNFLNYIELYYFFENFILNKNNIQNDYLNKKLKIININNNFKIYIEHILFLYEKASNKNNFLLSLLEYFKIKSNINNISYLTVDYDQSSSGPMLYGILSKDKKMLDLTNLFSCNLKKDLYVDFLNKFKDGLKDYKYIPINIFKRNNFAKLLIMPIFYNMGDKGIKKLLLNIFEENNLLKEKNYLEKKKEVINFLLKYINDILEKNYTNTILFQKNLVNICKILKEKNIPISFYTLDGAYVEYKYIKFDYAYGYIKDYRKRKKTYKILLPIENQNKLDNNHYLTFPPNFIQAIDGAICRIMVNIYYQITNRIIEPLHDSFRIPIKDIELISNLLKYIYIYIFFNSYFHKNKIGINIKNNIIEKNSLCYEKYKQYFYFKQLTFKNNIIYDYFINVLKIDLETKETVINKIFKEKIYNKEFEDFEIDNILKSNFFFYF